MRCYRIAGILADNSKICIEEITEVKAGEPCIYIADQNDVIFFEYGEKVSSPLGYTETNGLRGFFETTAKAPKGSYVLKEGAWYQVTTDRPAIDNYTAIIYRLNGITELASWDGLTMDIYDDLNGIRSIEKGNGVNAADGIYNLSGQRTQARHGVFIEVKDRQAKKIIKNDK